MCAAVDDALREYVTELSTVVPVDDATDLEPVDDVVADAAVVGLGEATHGTRECFECKHRLVRYLVERRGFRTVAFEADVAAMHAANEYVQSGDGDPAAALGELDMWQWRTEAVRDLLAWLRAFNDGRPPNDRVRVRGIDLSDPHAPATRLRATLQSLDVVDADAEELVALTARGVPDDDADRREWLDAVERAARSLRDAIDDRTTTGDDRTIREGVDAERCNLSTARHLCRVVVQNCEWARVRHEHDGPHPAGMAARDRLMAENVANLVEREVSNGVAVWAHNGHVQRGTFDDGEPWTDESTLGDHLDRRFGRRYVPIGFDAARGRFRAVERDTASGDPSTFSLDDPVDGSVTERLDELTAGPSFLDVAAAATDDELDAWLRQPKQVRYVGTVYAPNAPAAESYQRTPVAASYDGLVFVDQSTPTRPLDYS
jgi:erythromycin esterase